MTNPRATPLLLISLLVALLLHFQPLRGDVSYWRPLWVFIVALFWLLRDPQAFGVGFGWLVGLGLDVLNGGVIGQQAMAMALCAYLVQQAGQRLHHFSVWHQMLVVAFMAFFHQLVVVVFSLLMGRSADSWGMLYPVLSSALVWPLVAGLLGWAYRSVRVE